MAVEPIHYIFSLLVIAVVAAGIFAEPQQTQVTFLDVGQGDAILFQDKGRQILVDGGQGTAVLERLAEEMSPFDRTIELIVVTHPQQDHIEGILHLLQRYTVNLILLPNAPHDSQLQEAWIRAIEEAGSEYRFAWYGQQVQVGEFGIKILGPIDTPAAAAATKRDINNASTIMRVDVHDMSFLLTGDAEQPVERLLVQTVPGDVLDVDVMKAGHHGSKTSTTPELLSAATPEAVVISAGADNRFGHPHEDILRRLENLLVFRTDQQGSIRFIHTKRGWIISCGAKVKLRLRPKSCTQDEILTAQVF